MNPVRAERVKKLPAYLFVDIDRKRCEAEAAGRDVIDLGVGDPDLPTPGFIVRRMIEAVQNPANHRYPPGVGLPAFRERIAAWFRERFDVSLDPRTEVLVLIGSKEGIGHLPLAVVNPGDIVLVPDPGYPVYPAAATFAGAETVPMHLRRESGWMPAFEDVPSQVRRNARLMFLNYPNNPTAAVASLEAFERAVLFAREYNILIAQDAAYSQLHFGRRPPSILQVDGAQDIAVEFHSLSKTFSMTGWRVGFAAGNAEILDSLAQIKSNVDSGTFSAIQTAGCEAIEQSDHVEVRAQLDVYLERRDVFCEGMRACGFDVETPEATFYVWCACPAGYDSVRLATKVLEEAYVVLIPGVGFGRGGEGYVRAALTVSVERIQEAVQRIRRLNLT